MDPCKLEIRISDLERIIFRFHLGFREFILTCIDSRFVCRGPPKAADHRKVQKDLKTPCCSDFCPTAMPVSLKALGRGPGSAIKDFVGRFLGGSGVDKARLGEGARTSFGQGSAFRSKFLENSYKRFRHSAGRFWGKVPRKIVFLEGSGKGCRYRCGKVPESSAWGGAMPYIKEMPNKCCLQHTAFSLLWILSRVFFFRSWPMHHWWDLGGCEGSTSWRMLRLGGCFWSDVEKKPRPMRSVRANLKKAHKHTCLFCQAAHVPPGKGLLSLLSDVSFDAHLVGKFPSEEYFEGTPVNILCICIGGLGFKDFFIFTPNPWGNDPIWRRLQILSWVGGASLHLRSRCVFLRLLVVRFPKFTERGTTVGFCNACGIYW